MCSWVPIKRVSIINEYRVNSKRIINEYNLINEYTGIDYDYNKQVYGQISKTNGILRFFVKYQCKIDWKHGFSSNVTVDPKICQNCDFQSPKLVYLF